MNGSMNFFLDIFTYYFRALFSIPLGASMILIQSGEDTGVAFLVFFVLLAFAVVYLCTRLMKKYALGFTANVLLAFFVLSLAVGLMGLIMSIPYLGNASKPLLIAGIGSPPFNLVLGLMASLGYRVRENHPTVEALLFAGVGILFTMILATTFILFFYSLYNN